jgi:hypothetical protein
MPGAQHIGELGLVHDDNLAAAYLGNDLLTQQSAAAALDKVELRVNLVGAVYGQVDGPHLIQIPQRETQSACLVLGLMGDWNTKQVSDLAAAMLGGQGAKEVVDRAAVAKAHYHAGFDEINSGFGSLPFV